MTARLQLPPVDSTELPAAVPAAYLGVWRRTLLETPATLDTTSCVLWLQTPRWHADLRIPAGRPDFSGIARLAECSDAQLAWLATQQGFCGVTQVDGERCTWHRQTDFQPANGSRDVGRMAFDGERVSESGVEADYREIWVRLPESRGDSAALELAAEAGDVPPTWLLIAGDCFMFVRGRATSLPRAADLSTLIARTARSQWLAWLDFEISFGHCSGATPWRIEHSTLPFREGHRLTRPGAIQRRGHQLAIEAGTERRWRILDWSLGTSL
jgi:hypothetical protein